MNYVIRITGPGVDHQVMVNSAEDFEALELIIAKMRKHFEAETSGEPLPRLECGMGCGRTFCSPEGRDHHEELCNGPQAKTEGK